MRNQKKMKKKKDLVKRNGIGCIGGSLVNCKIIVSFLELCKLGGKSKVLFGAWL
jgi:hypothetical protein